MRTRNTALTRLTVALSLAAAALLSPSVATAGAPAAHWTVMAFAGPTYFKAGDVGDYFEVLAVNDGGAATDGSEISVADVLPAGVTATAISGETGSAHAFNFLYMSCSQATVSCHSSVGLAPGEVVRVKVIVSVAPGVSGSLTNRMDIIGGGANPGHAASSTPVSSAPVPFGASLVSHVASEDDSADTQAGSHPFGFTSIFAFNVGAVSRLECEPAQSHSCPELNFDPKDLEVALPAGFVGDPLAVPRCSQTTFQSYLIDNCPPDTQVGALEITSFYGNGSAHQYAPVYNVEPPPGQPAELGFTVGGFFHIPMFFHVRSNGDYGLIAEVKGISEVDIVQAGVLTMWGVPGARSHDAQRAGPGCEHGCASHAGEKPFLTLPTRCTGEELAVGVSGDSWQDPGTVVSLPSAYVPGMTRCDALLFAPSLEVQPEVIEPEVPSGYSVGLKVPQTDSQESLATPSLRDAVVRLPAGTVISASAANGLQACSEAQLGVGSTAAAECPGGSNIGDVEVETPLLEKPLHGSAFVAQPKCGGPGQPACTQASATNGELYGLYLVVEGYGIVIKLKGSVSANPVTGQLTATFKENPQLPFGELRVHLRGGPAAPLANPQSCGAFTATSDLMPWSAPATPDAFPSSTFQLAGCPSPVGFAPAFSAGTVVPNATGSSPFKLTVSRHAGEQYLSGVSTTLPPGLLGRIAQVPLCEGAQAAAGECAEASRIGTTSVAAGSGPYPYWLSGKVFLTGPYQGAPFGLSIVVPAKAGPFNLGNEVIRARVSVNPSNAAVTVVSDPLPQMKDGIPIRLGKVDVAIDRPGFMLNPSNCEQHSITGTLSGAQGAVESVSSPFAVEGCSSLSFKPRLSASTGAKASKRNGASLDVRVASHAGEANVAKVKVSLPKILPSRLETLQRACVAATFESNPASCPAAANVGTATVSTPVLAKPLSGPAILVSHGGQAFPDLDIVLQGEGITLILIGNTSISHAGITTSTFNTVPDAPIGSFELKLPTRPFSVLTAHAPGANHYSLCGQTLNMPTTITGQNGAVITQTTKIAVSGCPKAKTARQKLAAALAACRKNRTRASRAGCARAARRTYATLAKKAARTG